MSNDMWKLERFNIKKKNQNNSEAVKVKVGTVPPFTIGFNS